MTLDDFLAAFATRLPTADDLVGLCDDLGIEVRKDARGRAVLRGRADTLELSVKLARLIRREPWRTQVFQAKGLLPRPEPAPAPPAAPAEPLPTAGRVEVLDQPNGVKEMSAEEFTAARPGLGRAGWNWRYVGETAWRYPPAAGQPPRATEGPDAA